MIIDTDKIVAQCIELQKRNLRATDENYLNFKMEVTIYSGASCCEGPVFECYVPNAPRANGHKTPDAAFSDISHRLASPDALLAAAQTHEDEAKKIRERVAALKGDKVDCAFCDRGDGQLGHAIGCMKGGAQ